METIDVARDDRGVVTVTLNRPHRKNAANPTMWLELRDTFHEIGRSIDDRVVVLTGAGGEFCSGQDLSEMTAGVPGYAAMRNITEVISSLHQLRQPVIAKVVGVAAGAGMNLALGCDLIVASDTARFTEIFAKRGLSVDGGGSWILPRLIGLHKAKELVLFGDIVSAAQAAEIGIVNRVVPVDAIDAFVDEWAGRLAAGPPLAIALSKELLNAGLDRSMVQALEAEGIAQAYNFSTKDTVEAMTAFAAKRSPKFTGR